MEVAEAYRTPRLSTKFIADSKHFLEALLGENSSFLSNQFRKLDFQPRILYRAHF